MNLSTAAGGTETTGDGGAGGLVTIDAGGGGATNGAGGDAGDGGGIALTSGTGGNESGGGGTGGDAGSIVVTLGAVGTGAGAGTAGLVQLLPTTTDVGAVNIGDGSTDMDFKVFMDSVGAFVNFDQSAQEVIVEGTKFNFMDNDAIEFGSNADMIVDFDTGANVLMVVGTALFGTGVDVDGGTGHNVTGATNASISGGAISVIGGAGGTSDTGDAGDGGALTLAGAVGGEATGVGGEGGGGGAVAVTSGTGGTNSGGTGVGGNAGDITITLGGIGASAGGAPGSAGTVAFLSTTDDVGSVEIGDGTTDLDFQVFMGAAGTNVLFDTGSQEVIFEGTKINMMDDDPIEFGDLPEFVIDYDEAGSDDLRFVAAADLTLGYYFIAGTGLAGATNAGGLFDVVTGVGGAGTGGGTAGAGGAINISTAAGGTETTGDGGAGGLITIDAGAGGTTNGAAGDGGDGGGIALTSGTGGVSSGGGADTGGDAGDIVVKLGAVGTGDTAGTAGLVQFLPTTTDIGAVNIGNGTLDLDFKVFMDSTSAFVNFDQASQLVIVEGTDIQLMDDDVLLFGGLSGGDVTQTYDATAHTFALDPKGNHVRAHGLSDRFELVHQFGENGVPESIGSYAYSLIVDPQFMVEGTNSGDACTTADTEGGITLAVIATADGNEAILSPNSTAGAVWDDVTWDTDQSVRYEALIDTSGSIANCIIWVGLKKSNTEVMITDTDQAFFRYEDGVNGGEWEAITSVGGSDDNHDTNVPVATTTRYHLVIDINSSRMPSYWINGALVEVGGAMTNTVALKPYIAIADDGAAADNSMTVRSCAISRSFD